MWLAWLVSTASADPACPSGPDTLARAAADSEQAIADDAPERHEAAFRDARIGLQCFDGELPPGPWARLLLDEAIVRFAAGRPHEDLLAAALRADPGLAIPPFLVDRGLPDPTLPSVPGTLAYPTTVDGVPIDTPVALWGLHVVQAETPGGRVTLVIEDGGLPPTLLALPEAPPPPEPEPEPDAPAGPSQAWLGFGMGGGWGDTQQTVDRPGDLLADHLDRGPSVLAALWGRGPITGPLGFVGDLSIERRGTTPLTGGQLGLTVGTPAVAVFAGAGFVSVRLQDLDGPRTVQLPQPTLGLHLAAPGERPLDGWIAAGFTPSVWNVDLRWGTALARASEHVVLRIGTDLWAMGADFVQTPPGGRSVKVVRLGGGLHLGFAYGR